MTLPRWTLLATAAAGGAWLLAAASDLFAAGDLPWTWWAIRSLGLVAVASAWLGMLFGLAMSAKTGMVEPPVLLALHQQHTLAAVLATAAHALLAVVDASTDIPAIAVVIPATSPTLRGALALGTVAAWAFVALIASTALRPKLGPTAWRAVHGLAFGGFALALAHGWAAGTDAWAQPLYVAFGATVVGATLTRALATVAPA